MTVLITGLLFGVAVVFAFWAGAAHAHHRHARAACPVHPQTHQVASGRRRKPSAWVSLGRGPFVWLSVPLPGGFRIGRRL